MYSPLEGKPLINKKNQIKMADDVLGRVRFVLYFFSASWCQLCVDILPPLIRLYEESKKRESGLEIINVPCETEKHNMLEFFSKHGNWYSVLVGDMVAEELRWTYTITTIPTMIVINQEGEIVTKDGYRELLQCGLSALIKWI